ncbi:MAG: hypothetical protein RIT27_93 [Pseudomonadota bacterium]|jgi:hypothetical protein
MNTKENWLVAWSAIRLNNSISDHLYTSYKPRVSKEIKSILNIAIKCLKERDMCEKNDYLKVNLEIHMEEKGFHKLWTGYKYTWVTNEEFFNDDVSF